MSDEKGTEQIGERAANYFGDGYHCAEAVVAAFLETIGMEAPDAIAHATAFGGGFGKTFAEACGVLSGGLIAIGHLYGRRQRGESWELPAKLGAKFRDGFIAAYGTSNCGVLRQQFGEEQQMTECRTLVRNGAIALLKIYQNQRDKASAGGAVAEG